MKRAYLPGLATMAALMLTAMIAAALATIHPADFPLTRATWLPLLGVLVGVLTIVFTAMNVTRQIKIGIYSREEDRLEKILPGLIDAQNLCRPFLFHLRPLGSYGSVGGFFQNQGFRSQGPDDIKSEIQRRLPLSDETTRRELTAALGFVWQAGTAAAVTQLEISQHSIERQNHMGQKLVLDSILEVQKMRLAMFETQKVAYHDALSALQQLSVNLGTKHAYLARRAGRIRKTLEAYFGDEQV